MAFIDLHERIAARYDELGPEPVNAFFADERVHTSAAGAAFNAARVVDARTPERFRGIGETLDPVGGRIPGALNRFYRDNLQADGRFKPAVALRADFRNLLGETAPGQVVHQCGSGVTACHLALGLHLAGMSAPRLYAGSWSEWCADPARPVETGPARGR